MNIRVRREKKGNEVLVQLLIGSLLLLYIQRCLLKKEENKRKKNVEKERKSVCSSKSFLVT